MWRRMASYKSPYDKHRENEGRAYAKISKHSGDCIHHTNSGEGQNRIGASMRMERNCSERRIRRWGSVRVRRD